MYILYKELLDEVLIVVAAITEVIIATCNACTDSETTFPYTSFLAICFNLFLAVRLSSDGNTVFNKLQAYIKLPNTAVRCSGSPVLRSEERRVGKESTFLV